MDNLPLIQAAPPIQKRRGLQRLSLPSVPKAQICTLIKILDNRFRITLDYTMNADRVDIMMISLNY